MEKNMENDMTTGVILGDDVGCWIAASGPRESIETLDYYIGYYRMI